MITIKEDWPILVFTAVAVYSVVTLINIDSNCNDLCAPNPGHALVGTSGSSCRCLATVPPSGVETSCTQEVAP